MRRWYTLVALALLVCGGLPANAQTLDVDLNPATPGVADPGVINGAPGQTFNVQGELENNGLVTLYINGSNVQIIAPPGTFNITDVFLGSAPFFMDPGDATGFFDFFILDILAGAAPGSYVGIFEVLGSVNETDGALLPIGTQTFTVNVAAAASNVPEGDGLLIMLGALPALGLLWRRRKLALANQPGRYFG